MSTFSDTVNEYARYAHKTVADAHSDLITVINFIQDMLAQKQDVILHGLGKFSTRDRAAFMSRNPATREPIEVPACTLPTFKFSLRVKNQVKEACRENQD